MNTLETRYKDNNMKIVSINAVSYGSTGKIMRGIAHTAEEDISAKCYTFYGNCYMGDSS